MTNAPTLSAGQQDAAESFFRFLMSEDRFFGLSGSAGTGKTYLMGHLCETVMTRYQRACKVLQVPVEYTALYFTATTNKAAEVLEGHLQRNVTTLHQLIGLKVKDDYRTGKTSVTRTRSYRTRSACIVFIDECSMVDAQMLKEIENAFLDAKIVFVGDHSQMTPVGEKLCLAFEQVSPENMAILTEPLRNAGQPILMRACRELRDAVEEARLPRVVEGPGVLETLGDVEMDVKLKEIFAQDMQPSARVLCYTNERVRAYNAYIREIRGLDPDFQPGDRVVMGSTHNLPGITLNAERELLITKVGTDIRSLGHEDASPDGQPVLGRDMQVELRSRRLSANLTICVPVQEKHFRETLRTYRQRKSWGQFFELQGACADIRDQAACTVYKAQGSTYDQVVVDVGNIGRCWDVEQISRMLFVGISRARHNAWLFGRLPAKHLQNYK